jgi:small conductance mechanosensitive channel
MKGESTSSAVRLVDIFVTHVLPRTGVALALLLIFWIAALILERGVSRVGRRRDLDLDLTNLLGRLARLSLVVFGAVTAIGTLGIDVKALVAGLGLTGFALGFALKDIISNSLAGILILFYKPFRRDDRIEVAGTTGRVDGINMRYTILAANDGTRVLVPNSILFTNSIRVTVSDPSKQSDAADPVDASGPASRL